MRAKIPENMTAIAGYLESQIVGPWALGERFSGSTAICHPKRRTQTSWPLR